MKEHYTLETFDPENKRHQQGEKMPAEISVIFLSGAIFALKTVGQSLEILRKQRGISKPTVAVALDQLAEDIASLNEQLAEAVAVAQPDFDIAVKIVDPQQPQPKGKKS